MRHMAFNYHSVCSGFIVVLQFNEERAVIVRTNGGVLSVQHDDD